MPLEPRTPAWNAALEVFIAEVEKLMREKLTGIGDFKNLAELETEIDRLTLRVELLNTDPEFQDAMKRIDLKRQDMARKRDQMKPFLLKCEREIAIYRGQMSNVAAPAAPMQVQAPVAAAPVMQAAAPQPVAAAPAATVMAGWQAPAQAAAPAPVAPAAPARPAPPPPMKPPMQAAPAAPAFDPFSGIPMEGDAPAARPEVDMSLPPEEDMPEGSFVSAPTDFITGPGSMDTSGDGSLLLEEMQPEPAAAPQAAPASPAQQWPPPGQAIPDPFATFQPAAPQPPARPAAPAAAPAAAPRPAAPPAAAPRPAPAQPPRPAAPAAAPAAAQRPAPQTPGVKPPWQK